MTSVSDIQSVQLSSRADASGAAIATYGWRVPSPITIVDVRVITNQDGSGILQTSTVKLKNDTASTIPATLTTDVASVGAGGTAKLTAGSVFAATLSADVSPLTGDLLYLETATANVSDTIKAGTVAEVFYIQRQSP